MPVKICNHDNYSIFPVIEKIIPEKLIFYLENPFRIVIFTYGKERFFHYPELFHLYSTKAAGYIEGSFYICLFTIGFINPYYYIMIAAGIIEAIEHIIIQLIIPEMRYNVKGLYKILKEKK